ncbi:MAG TPA: hypothetical protein RMG48_15755 [Myxococcales bacterium LLY-WYZ-16_1]|nr:hypothetical protein [Myxococcales bacterium LLY-WYZ-16_1]
MLIDFLKNLLFVPVDVFVPDEAARDGIKAGMHGAFAGLAAATGDAASAGKMAAELAAQHGLAAAEEAVGAVAKAAGADSREVDQVVGFVAGGLGRSLEASVEVAALESAVGVGLGLSIGAGAEAASDGKIEASEGLAQGAGLARGWFRWEAASPPSAAPTGLTEAGSTARAPAPGAPGRARAAKTLEGRKTEAGAAQAIDGAGEAVRLDRARTLRPTDGAPPGADPGIMDARPTDGSQVGARRLTVDGKAISERAAQLGAGVAGAAVSATAHPEDDREVALRAGFAWGMDAGGLGVSTAEAVRARRAAQQAEARARAAQPSPGDAPLRASSADAEAAEAVHAGPRVDAATAAHARAAEARRAADHAAREVERRVLQLGAGAGLAALRSLDGRSGAEAMAWGRGWTGRARSAAEGVRTLAERPGGAAAARVLAEAGGLGLQVAADVFGDATRRNGRNTRTAHRLQAAATGFDRAAAAVSGPEALTDPSSGLDE